MSSQKDEKKEVAAFVNVNDPTFLAVKGFIEDKFAAKSYVKNLAQAIVVTYQKHGTVNLRCIGAGAVNHAVKAMIIAFGDSKKKGIDLYFLPSFATVQFESGEDRTAIVFNVCDFSPKNSQ
jgi:stage V sporulation protein S